jgi:hypothetical protein
MLPSPIRQPPHLFAELVLCFGRYLKHLLCRGRSYCRQRDETDQLLARPKGEVDLLRTPTDV